LVATKVQITKQIRIEAAPESVFPYLIDPEKVVVWSGIAAELDPTPGGDYRVTMMPCVIAAGKFVEVTPYSKVSYTWGWDDDDNPIRPGSSLVEIELEPDGDATVLTLMHSGLPDDAVEQHGHGWDHFMERLLVAGAGTDPGRDPWLDNPPH
jgi:uncharacterized protein YndB with AHSA1/START domain